MEGNCNGKCAEHSGVEKSIEVLESSDNELKQTINKIYTKTNAILVSVTITSLLLLINFMIKHFETTRVIAQEIIVK